MSTTTEAATWPRVEATLHEDGTAEVSIGGSVQTINAQNVDEARPQVVALIAQRAAQLGRPLRALTRDPEGEWPTSSATVPSPWMMIGHSQIGRANV